MTAAKYKLDNLAVIVDYTRVQLDGSNDEILPLHDLGKKIEAFGWNVIECDGHRIQALLDALDQAKKAREKPTAIIANTVKGKGIDFMENDVRWHYGGLDTDLIEKAKASVERMYAAG